MGIKQLIAKLFILIIFGVTRSVLANDFIIDDRRSGNLKSNLGIEWHVVTDQVMGGMSSGKLTLDRYRGRDCLRMQGDVSTENNGGFVQIALSLSDQDHFDASAFAGIVMQVAGNNEDYNLHFRTSDLGFPWQSYRARFKATSDWQTLRIPFDDLEAYKTTQKFRPNKLKRIGLVGIGRDFKADLCLASIHFYSGNN
ncbi:CIA30 family protein [Methylicorpusculum oleiharenae]|uniref:CIA30 family protein n=1 Tax=Methylicorpusculum oleiharenae TaxID=1338687 RepID=UPI00135951E4|nr:CIA30 family protein [Methylicorpusculum oleiharenae]MCD2453761.1 CIA30 family protein [Methylicorpusculum oleiharenae]